MIDYDKQLLWDRLAVKINRRLVVDEITRLEEMDQLSAYQEECLTKLYQMLSELTKGPWHQPRAESQS